MPTILREVFIGAGASPFLPGRQSPDGGHRPWVAIAHGWASPVGGHRPGVGIGPLVGIAPCRHPPIRSYSLNGGSWSASVGPTKCAGRTRNRNTSGTGTRGRRGRASTPRRRSRPPTAGAAVRQTPQSGRARRSIQRRCLFARQLATLARMGPGDDSPVEGTRLRSRRRALTRSHGRSNRFRQTMEESNFFFVAGGATG